ncbi:MAG: immunoglobulin-like domain-containing protein [Hominenteromicrobium sp.]
MRYLRIAVIFIFIVSVAVNIGATIADNRNHDSTIPELTSSIESLELSVNSTDEDLLQGLTATDEKDGDLTDKIMIAGRSRMLENNTCKIKYVVFDSNNNSATLTRVVRYTDYEPPRFSLTDPLLYTTGADINYLDRIQAADGIDGDISDKIKVKSGSVNSYQAGTYPVVLEVSNSYGDRVQVELNVVVADDLEERPSIELSEYLVYLRVGDSFSANRYLRSVRDADGSAISAGSVSISGSVDTGTPGYYHLAYSVMSGGKKGQTYLTVVVTE